MVPFGLEIKSKLHSLSGPCFCSGFLYNCLSSNSFEKWANPPALIHGGSEKMPVSDPGPILWPGHSGLYGHWPLLDWRVSSSGVLCNGKLRRGSHLCCPLCFTWTCCETADRSPDPEKWEVELERGLITCESLPTVPDAKPCAYPSRCNAVPGFPGFLELPQEAPFHVLFVT